MKPAIFATLNHCTSTDQNPQHQKCPQGEDFWCFFNRAIAKQENPAPHDQMAKTPLSDRVIEKILPSYERLSSDALLKRCDTVTCQFG